MRNQEFLEESFFDKNLKNNKFSDEPLLIKITYCEKIHGNFASCREEFPMGKEVRHQLYGFMALALMATILHP